jgi:quercetin dioxygenase-like cupin family protein
MVLVTGVLTSTGLAGATPASGVSGTVLANSTVPNPIRTRLDVGSEDMNTDLEVRNVQIAKFTTEPGGQFGWHQHSGPIWVVITSGTLNLYSGDDPDCRPTAFAAGAAFLDPGNHTHIARNESSEPVELYAIYMLPEGGAPRLDVEAPGNCSF